AGGDAQRAALRLLRRGRRWAVQERLGVVLGDGRQRDARGLQRGQQLARQAGVAGRGVARAEEERRREGGAGGRGGRGGAAAGGARAQRGGAVAQEAAEGERNGRHQPAAPPRCVWAIAATRPCSTWAAAWSHVRCARSVSPARARAARRSGSLSSRSSASAM